MTKVAVLRASEKGLHLQKGRRNYNLKNENKNRDGDVKTNQHSSK